MDVQQLLHLPLKEQLVSVNLTALSNHLMHFKFKINTSSNIRCSNLSSFFF